MWLLQMNTGLDSKSKIKNTITLQFNYSTTLSAQSKPWQQLSSKQSHLEVQSVAVLELFCHYTVSFIHPGPFFQGRSRGGKCAYYD